MSNWPDCIVSYFDLVGIRKKIAAGNSEASNLMQTMHECVYRNISHNMPAHAHAYAWNDSALFLAFIEGDEDYEKIMRELNLLKPELDVICPCYGICVKGQAMPEPQPFAGHHFNGTAAWGQPRFVFMRTSSYAFTNVFTIEEELGKQKKMRMDWYIDSRIADQIDSFPPAERHPVMMMPSRNNRDVAVLKGKIWV